MGWVRWTKEEDEILIKLYSKMSAREIAEKYLQNRSISGIHRRVRVLNLSNHIEKWTPKEKALVFEHYKEMSPSELRDKYLPHKTSNAVKRYATIARIECEKRYMCYKKWTAKEDKILANLYYIMTPMEISDLFLPNRTPKAIIQRFYGLESHKNEE